MHEDKHDCQANHSFREANEEHGAKDNHNMREHVQDMLDWVKQVVAENVDLILEDFKDFADRSDIKECVYWCEQDSSQRHLQDVSTHVTFVALDDQVSEVRQKDCNCRSDGGFFHVVRVLIRLFFRVNS